MALRVDFISEEKVAEAVSLLDELASRLRLLSGSPDGEVVASIKDIFLSHSPKPVHTCEAFFQVVVVVVVRGVCMRVNNRDDLLEFRIAILERLPFNPPSAAAGSEGFQFFS